MSCAIFIHDENGRNERESMKVECAGTQIEMESNMDWIDLGLGNKMQKGLIDIILFVLIRSMALWCQSVYRLLNLVVRSRVADREINRQAYECNGREEVQKPN